MHVAATFYLSLSLSVCVCVCILLFIYAFVSVYMQNEGKGERNLKKVHKEDDHDFYSFLGEDTGSEKLQGCIG